MKKSLKNETDILNLINKLQEQLIALDKKVDILVHRSLPERSPAPKPLSITPPANPHNHNKGREQHKAICADCRKECTIPFKPTGDRPVYCQDCFSRRKVIRLSGIKVEDKPQEAAPVQKSEIKKKKAVAVKKSIGKKKPTPKKK